MLAATQNEKSKVVVKRSSKTLFDMLRQNESGYFFKTTRPSVHTKPVNPLTETACFWNRYLELLLIPVHTIPGKQIRRFKNVQIRVDQARFTKRTEWNS